MQAVIATRLNKEDVDKVDKQLEGAIQKQLVENVELERSIDEKREPKEKLDEDRKELSSLRQEGNHLQNQLLETTAYNDDISSHAEPKAQYEIYAQARRIGLRKAELEREEQKAEHKKRTAEAKFERKVIEGEEKGLDKPFSKDMLDTIEKEGAEEASLEQAKEQKESKAKVIKAKRDAEVAQAAVNYTKSPEYTATEAKILQNTIDARQQEKEKQQYDILDKTNQHLTRAEAERHVAEINALNPGDASSVVQLNALNEQMVNLEKARKKQVNQINSDMTKKQKIMDNTYGIEKYKVQQNPNDTIQNFISEYPQHQTVPSDYTDMDPNFLKTFSLAYQNWNYNPKIAYGQDWGNDDNTDNG